MLDSELSYLTQQKELHRWECHNRQTNYNMTSKYRIGKEFICIDSKVSPQIITVKWSGSW